MVHYEVTFVITPDFDEEKTQNLLKDIKETIEDKNGRIIDVDVWGKRKLAYEIEGFNTGFYVVIQFEAPSDTPAELERVLKITDEVIRFIILKREDKKLSAKN